MKGRSSSKLVGSAEPSAAVPFSILRNCAPSIVGLEQRPQNKSTVHSTCTNVHLGRSLLELKGALHYHTDMRFPSQLVATNLSKPREQDATLHILPAVIITSDCRLDSIACFQSRSQCDNMSGLTGRQIRLLCSRHRSTTHSVEHHPVKN